MKSEEQIRKKREEGTFSVLLRPFFFVFVVLPKKELPKKGEGKKNTRNQSTFAPSVSLSLCE